MDGHLCIRFGPEDMTALHQFLFQSDIILDYAVVDQRNFIIAICHWMSVVLERLAVRRPSGVSDPESSLHLGHDLFQVSDLSLVLEYVHLPVGYGHARGIVTPVFESLQPREYDFLGRSVASVTYDTAHSRCTYMTLVLFSTLSSILV